MTIGADAAPAASASGAQQDQDAVGRPPGSQPDAGRPDAGRPETERPDAARQEAGWREVVAELAVRAGERGRAIASTVRPLGWVLIALTIGSWLLGVMLGWRELIVGGVVLLAIVVICAAFLIGRTVYDVSLDLARTRVVVGERAIGSLTLANHSQRSILPSRVVLPVGAGRGEFAIRRLAPGQVEEELFAIPTQRRGVVEVGPVSVVRGDPLGLFERARRRDEPVDLYVHPRTVRFDGQSLGFLHDLEGLPTADLSRDDISFHALLEYQPGDDLRHVHWGATAHTGTMMVRQFEETRRSRFVIGLSTSRGDYRDADEFELAVSIAGSVGLRALRDSQEVDLRVQGRPLPADDGRRLLDSLSRLGQSRRREGGVQDLATTIAAGAPSASVVVLVCGSAVRSEALRTACSRVPFGARGLAIVVENGVVEPTLRRVGDADVVTLGVLDDLPRALHKVLA